MQKIVTIKKLIILYLPALRPLCSGVKATGTKNTDSGCCNLCSFLNSIKVKY